MQLSEIFNQLSTGEFSQLRIGGNQEGVIDENNYDKIVNHVNMGLTALYKRFNLKEGRLKVVLQNDRTTYPLTTAYAISNTKSKEPIKYIDDFQNKFNSDILKVEKVIADTSCEIGLNDSMDIYSIHTPNSTTIRVPKILVDGTKEMPDWLKTKNLEVVYRAKHVAIVVGLGYFDPERVTMELPDAYLEALCLWIAARVHMPVGLQGEPIHSNMYYQKYEAECQRLEQDNLEIDQGVTNLRAIKGGWT